MLMILSLIIYHDISKTYSLTKHTNNLKQPYCPKITYFEWSKLTQNFLITKIIQYDINNIDTNNELLITNFCIKHISDEKLFRIES